MKIFWSLLKVLLMILKTKQQQQQKPVFWFYFWSKWKCESKTIQQIISIRWTVVSEADTLKHQWPKMFFVNLIWYNKKLLTVEEATAHWAILWEVRNDCGGGGEFKWGHYTSTWLQQVHGATHIFHNTSKAIPISHSYNVCT